ncbi:DNA internalization-related competence protein ComEC/Rec2 [Catenovulum maritimum]|uniref:Metallo-beta-lactamase domain-containing protein n=1 Tax=Catenovulum maritimum TaxID=1513271 RepID=A0A0J8GLY6_9ALTE|nr:DNA internalization-related competence protein ComEC/Rec2 [Catenovulum maritimum]KMT63837.1 hypothetical protein XM47_17660 [Catenovulum maritimum]
MEACLIWFILGNLTASQFPKLISFDELIMTTALMFLAIFFKRFQAACFALGFNLLFAVVLLTISIPSKHFNLGSDISISGQIITLVKQEKNKIRFDLEVDCISVKAQQKDFICDTSFLLNPKVRLVWYYPKTQLSLGNRVQLSVKLKELTGLHNQAGFNYQKWLFSKNYLATGYIKQLLKVEDIPNSRANYFSRFLAEYESYPHKGFMLGLLLGNRDYISAPEWQVLTRTGTGHLLAISGLHLGLVFGWSWLVFKVMVRPLSLLLKINLESSLLLLALSSTWFFAYFTGLATPSIRAGIFISIFVVSIYLKLNLSWRLKYFLAMAMILTIDPLASLSISFWLSFYAAAVVLGLVWFLRQWQFKSTGLVRYLYYFLIFQAVLFITLLPVQIAFFSHIPLVSFFANTIAIPAVSFIILPVLLLSALCLSLSSYLSIFLADIASYVLTILYQYLSWLSHIKWAYVAVPNNFIFEISVVLLVLLLFVIAYILNSNRKVFVSILVGYSSIFLVYVLGEKPTWQIDVMDVGQGLAIVISHNGQAVVYDTGDAFNTGFNLFEAAVEPSLKAQGLKLVAVITSHADKDHAGGLEYIQANYPSTKIWFPEQHCQNLEQNLIGLSWQVLWPTAQALLNKNQISKNNLSCVLRVSKFGKSVLLTGDIEADTEAKLVNLHSDELISNAFLVPHHGSKTSSQQLFIDSISPTYAIISRGKDNRFGHPHLSVVEKLNASEIRILDTAVHGQIRFQFTAKQAPKLSYYNQSAFIPWHSKIFRGDL